MRYDDYQTYACTYVPHQSLDESRRYSHLVFVKVQFYRWLKQNDIMYCVVGIMM